MPSKPTDVDALKIAIDENGTATLSGINYGDLRSILTGASLNRYDHPFAPKALDGSMDEIVHANNMDSALWELRHKLILDVLDARMDGAIRPEYANEHSKVEGAKDTFRRAEKRLDEKVREAEREAAAKRDGAVSDSAVKESDTLAEIASALRLAVQQANGALAQLERVRSGKST